VRLPPNVNKQQFSRAMKSFASIVGEDWAFSDEERLEPYADPFSPKIGNGQPLPSGVVAPRSVDEVRAVIETANQFRTPLWVVSTGKNFGYGGCEACVAGSVILDLKRMNRILEVNEELAYAVVEPGVSQYDFWRYCQKNGFNLWIDGPSPAWASVVANTIERGVGYAAKGDRFDQVCGMEIVLPNGELMRTGMGAIEGAPTWNTYKYGLGPFVDGMFSQSNLGVVTKMGVYLNAQPESYRSIVIDAPEYRQVVELIDTMRELRITGVVRTAASIVSTAQDNHEVAAKVMRGIASAKGDLDKVYAMIEQTVGWRVRIGISGHTAQVEADWRKIYASFRQAIPNCSIGSDLYEAPYNYDQMDSIAKLQAAVPSMQETEIWPHNAVFISTMLPCKGSEFWKQVEVMRDVFVRHGQFFIDAPIHFHTERSIMTILGTMIEPGNIEQNKQAVALGKEIIEVAGENGWGEYRTPTTFMQAASDVYSFNNHALRRFCESVKDAIDPNGILAPGKNGIWPKSMRDKA